MICDLDFRAVLMTSAAIALCACDSKVETDPIGPKACLSAIPAPVTLPAGFAKLGSERAYREEAPVRAARFDSFDMDATEVTNAQFSAFIAASGYQTDAEKPQAGFGAPGGAVFTLPGPQNASWWRFVEGANWRHPEGPGSTLDGKETEPVVQISLRDAKAYADWAGRRLPTADEWEYGAKGGSESVYVWGHERAPGGQEQANSWQGAFPLTNSEADGYRLRAPAGCYKPNGYGLYDMIGNVWEWTDTPIDGSPGAPAQYTIKGGSFLCAPNYCRRYRASALQPQDADFTTNHIGFRTISR